jgi:hypothetical protein
VSELVKVGGVLLRFFEYVQVSDYSVSLNSKSEVIWGFYVPTFEQLLAGVTVKRVVNF